MRPHRGFVGIPPPCNHTQQDIHVPTVGGNTGFHAMQLYSYDALNRLGQATELINAGVSWQQTFSYDRFGNRNFNESGTTTLPKNCSGAVCASDRKVLNPEILPSNNRIKGDQDGDFVDDYTFDASGNTTKQANGNTITYDAENKQTEVKNSSNVTIGQYWYDGDGKRVKKYVPATGETTVFVYDASGRLVGEYSTNLNPAPQVSYLTNDHLGSPRINTDQNGAVISRHDYHPFGEEITGGSRTSGLGYVADDNRKQFTGYERDDETGLDFAQARMYANGFGRFTTTDPLFFQDDRLIFPQRLNLYVYASNNPMKYTDPNGLDIVVSGKEVDKRIEDINNRDAGKFKVKPGQGGVLEIVDEKNLDVSKLDAREKALYDAIKDPTNRATLKGMDATDDYQYGAYGPEIGEKAGTNLLDNGDLKLLRDQSKSAAAEVVLHEVMEAYAAAKDPTGGWAKHHAEANQFTGNVENIAGVGNPSKITPIAGTNPQMYGGARETVFIKTPSQTIRWDQTIVFKKDLTGQQLVPWPPKATITEIKNKQVVK